MGTRYKAEKVIQGNDYLLFCQSVIVLFVKMSSSSVSFSILQITFSFNCQFKKDIHNSDCDPPFSP